MEDEKMSKVNVIYWSGTGHTEAMANAIVKGAEGAGAEVKLIPVGQATEDDVKEVAAGYECGLVFEKFNDLQEDDQIEAYMMVEVPR